MGACNRTRFLILQMAMWGATLPLPLLPMPTSAQAPAAGNLDTSPLEFAFEELVTLAPSVHPGKTRPGERNIVPITGGTFSGPNIKGTILPGEWDWQSTTGGCTRLNADYMLKTDDGVTVNVINRATSCDRKSANENMTITTPVFEAPLGRYDWLNDAVFIGSLKVVTFEGKLAVQIRFFKVR